MFRRHSRGFVQAAVIGALVLACEHPRPATAQAALPSGREIVARHLAAMGGEAAFKAVASMHARGRLVLTAQQISGDIEVFSARPNKQLVRGNITGFGATETGFDGKVGWSIEPVSGATLLTGRQLLELADDAVFDSPLYPPSLVKSLDVLGREEFDGRQAYRVKVTYVSGSEQFELFDVETGLQIGTEARRETLMGVLPTTMIAREHKSFGALRLPTVLVQKALGFEQVVTLSSYEFNSVKPETFVPPPQIRALIKAPAPALVSMIR
jgi:hypothetical protein